MPDKKERQKRMSHEDRFPVSGTSRGGAAGAVWRWAQLLVGILVISAFAFGLIPALQRLEPIRGIREAVEDRGIDATALFYTEIEVSSEAEASIRDAIRYTNHRVRPGNQQDRERASGQRR